MSYDPNFPTDEARRDRALDQAILAAPTGSDAGGIVGAAAVFEGYLKDGAEDVDPGDLISVQLQPPAGAPRPTLEQPRHADDQFMEDCLACKWARLRDEIEGPDAQG